MAKITVILPLNARHTSLLVDISEFENLTLTKMLQRLFEQRYEQELKELYDEAEYQLHHPSSTNLDDEIPF